jgi:hypothetical protein
MSRALGFWGPVALFGTAFAVACSSTTTGPSTDDAGTGSPDAATTATSTSTGSSTSSSSADAGPNLPPPATFDLTSGVCADIPGCGGSLEGSWDYSAACIPDSAAKNLETQIRKACATAAVTGVTGTMSGRVTFAGTSVVRKATTSLKISLSIPASCAAQAGGNCNLVAAAIQSQSGGQVRSANCKTAASGNGCDCVLDSEAAGDKTGTTYATSGNTLITSDGDEYEYCVTGTKLTHKQTKSGSPNLTEPGNFEATKR